MGEGIEEMSSHVCGRVDGEVGDRRETRAVRGRRWDVVLSGAVGVTGREGGVWPEGCVGEGERREEGTCRAERGEASSPCGRLYRGIDATLDKELRPEKDYACVERRVWVRGSEG